MIFSNCAAKNKDGAPQFFPFELQIVHTNVKVPQEEKMHDIFNWTLMKNI